ncbi:LPS export ABC transporter periplasmic protein LptC [Rhodanobacter aciditrophus]|uniref:LPS export ABC transporter periplasmic protein LptC n=1 Tax=Rhodanobacter aciditrophus TaxID=1623218 RepID=A0ABW4B328_9GAMM
MAIKYILERKRLIGVACILIVFVLIFILGNKPSLYLIEEQKLVSSPDYFLENVTTKTYAVNGNLVEEVAANTANHYNASKETLLIRPVITRTEPGATTIAQAENGAINDSSKNFTLNGDASVVRTSSDNKNVKIEAQTITYDDSSQLITGKAQAKLSSAQINTSSDIIIHNLKEETTSLDGGVVGTYEPEKN